MTAQQIIMLERIRVLLDVASVTADEAAMNESRASDPFTALAQLIDSALARAEGLSGR